MRRRVTGRTEPFPSRLLCFYCHECGRKKKVLVSVFHKKVKTNRSFPLFGDGAKPLKPVQQQSQQPGNHFIC